MNVSHDSVRLYAVTDRAWTGKQTLYEQVEAALRNGATIVQLREKTLDRQSFYEEACVIRELCSRYDVPFIINDDVELAVACHADGVHVGQDDLSVEEVRRRVGDKMIIGVSSHNVREAVAAERGGADYLGAGSVFSTSTKTNVSSLSYESLREICRAVSIPVVAIGGITKDNLFQLTGSGVDGVAVVSAIFGASDPASATRDLRARVDAMVTAQKDYIIFDMDGTLVDSMPVWSRLCGEYLAANGVPDADDSVFKHIQMMTVSAACAYLSERFFPEKKPQTIEDEINELMLHHYQTDIPLKSWVRPFLQACKDRGVRMCVASTTKFPLIQACLTHHDIIGYFDFILSCEDIGADKRNPAIYLAAAERFGVSADEIAVYEDSCTAANTAKHAGFTVIGVEDRSAASKRGQLCLLADGMITHCE